MGEVLIDSSPPPSVKEKGASRRGKSSRGSQGGLAAGRRKSSTPVHITKEGGGGGREEGGNLREEWCSAREGERIIGVGSFAVVRRGETRRGKELAIYEMRFLDNVSALSPSG